MYSWSKNFARAPIVLLVIVEAFVLFASVYGACAIVFGSVGFSTDVLGPIAPRAVAMAFVMVMSLIAMGLYQFRQRMYFHEVIVRIVVGVALGGIGLATVYYVFPSITLQPKIGALATLIALVGLLLVRFFFVKNVDENVFRRRTLVYGAGDRAASIAKLKRRADRRGFHIIGMVPAAGDTVRVKASELMDDSRSLIEIALQTDVDEIVVAMDDRRENLPIRELMDCKLRGIDVIDILEFLERETGRIHIDLVTPGWLIFAPGFRITRARRVVKRTLDIILGLVGLLIAWPVMLIVALAIKAEEGVRVPVIYRQSRVGYHGDVFSVFKFRSMRVDAEADGKAVWAQENDTRITRVGSIIRKIRFDELPQIINVLLGQMSVVGPRPERPEFVAELRADIPYYQERHTVKPGITGWAQLKYAYGSSREDAEQKLRYDLYYVKNHSLLLDLIIVLQTLEVVLWRKGAR